MTKLAKPKTETKQPELKAPVSQRFKPGDVERCTFAMKADKKMTENGKEKRFVIVGRQTETAQKQTVLLLPARMAPGEKDERIHISRDHLRLIMELSVESGFSAGMGDQYFSVAPKDGHKMVAAINQSVSNIYAGRVTSAGYKFKADNGAAEAVGQFLEVLSHGRGIAVSPGNMK
jgi:hypothetical protein